MIKSCPYCATPTPVFGRLGRLTHYRCKACGLEWSRPEQEQDDEQQELCIPGNEQMSDLPD